MHRHELTDREWKLVEAHTLGRSWRGLPERFGPWNTVARRFRRWAQTGAGEKLFRAVHEPDYEWVLVDPTTVKAHKAAASQKKFGPSRVFRPQPGRLLHQAPHRSRCLR